MQQNEEVFFYLVGVMGAIVGVFGLIGNTLSLAVLSRREMRGSNSTLYLINLGIYDMIFLILNLLLTSLDWLVYGIDQFSSFSLLFTVPASVIVDPIISLTIYGSVYTTVALSIDRTIAVVKPLSWTSICTRFRVKMTLLLVFMWSFLTTGPLFFEFKFKEIVLPEFGNESFLLSVESKYGGSDFHQDVYLPYLIPLSTFLLPVVAIFTSNVVILVTLKHKRKANKHILPNSKQRQSSLMTGQVMFISVFTLVSRLLHGGSYIAMKHEGSPYITETSLPTAVLAACNAFFITLNSAINFICYCVFGAKFRAAFVTMVYSWFPCCKASK